jgi:hypothetical protein
MIDETNLPAVHTDNRQLSAFSSIQNFEVAQRMAKALAESELVPTTYKNKIANCLVALEVAQRCQASPLMVMQNLNIIHGRPSWSSTYIIAAVNSCGRFAPLKFKLEGEGDKRSCIAWTSELKTGELLEGPPVSIAMAKAEGWYGKTGSKWQTMPELMLRYRSAAFFGRLYASEILMGMRSDDEEREIIDVTPGKVEDAAQTSAVESLNKKIRSKSKEPKPAVAEEIRVDASAETLPPGEAEAHL